MQEASLSWQIPRTDTFYLKRLEFEVSHAETVSTSPKNSMDFIKTSHDCSALCVNMQDEGILSWLCPRVDNSALDKWGICSQCFLLKCISD